MENRESQQHSAVIPGQEEGTDGKCSEFHSNTEVW